jgi:hypothetical protein
VANDIALRASVPLDRNNRPAIARAQQAFFNGALEGVIMRDHEPSRIGGGNLEFCGERLPRRPCLHRPVVNCITDAPHIGRRVAGIFPSADIGQLQYGSRLNIAK